MAREIDFLPDDLGTRFDLAAPTAVPPPPPSKIFAWGSYSRRESLGRLGTESVLDPKADSETDESPCRSAQSSGAPAVEPAI